MERQRQLIELMDHCMEVIAIDVTVKDPFIQKKDRTDTMEAILDILRLRNVPERQIRPLSRKLYDCLFGQALLTELLSDPLVSDIKILAHDQIRLKRLNHRKNAGICFQNPGQYLHFVEYLLIRNDIQPDSPHGYLSFCDADASPEDLLCLHVSSRRINSVNTPYLHIHRIPKQKKYLRDLIASGMLESQTASYLSAQARYGGCILFTGRGKREQSTLLNALIDLIPHDRSALAIQEREELFSLSHPEIMFQHATPASRVLSSYDTRELMENGLLLDSDYFILDELRQENALPFWRAVSQGCHCWATIQGQDTRQALEHLADYLYQGSSCPRETILPSLCHVSTIICLENGKVTELMEIQGWDPVSRNLKLNSLL